MNVETWNEETQGPFSLEAIRSLYQPSHHFRIQRHRYEAYTPFKSWSVAHTYYVLSGTMRIDDGAQTYALQARQSISLPKGNYTITYPEAVDLVKVLELPEQAWEAERRHHERAP
jgi:mannose-6-phosphate isomerase-like protein (cupin superfamily)